jgi:hypothetical protein
LGAKEAEEIQRTLQYLNRSDPQEFLSCRIERAWGWRDRKIAEAVKDWRYSQKEIPDCMGIYASIVSRILRRPASETSKSKT